MLARRSALVTGSTSGIGLGVARALAAAGASLTLNGFRDADRVEVLMAELRSAYGVEVRYDDGDLRQPARIEALVADHEAAYGSLDVLVNNAGVEKLAPVEAVSDELWDEIIAVNLSAQFHAIRAALPGMKASGWGRIVNIASVAGLIASAENAPYDAAKHGVIGLTRVVALETAAFGITCNAICPGYADSPMLAPLVEAAVAHGPGDRAAAVRAFVKRRQPSGRLVAPAEIGALAVFLCSGAAAQVTGACYPIDGGWTAQ